MTPKWNDIKDWLIFLDEESERRSKFLKVYFVYGNDVDYSYESRFKELKTLGEEVGLRNVALTFVPSFMDESSQVHLNEINPEFESTILIYKRSIIIGKLLDKKPGVLGNYLIRTSENFIEVSEILDRHINEYFDLPRPQRIKRFISEELPCRR